MKDDDDDNALIEYFEKQDIEKIVEEADNEEVEEDIPSSTLRKMYKTFLFLGEKDFSFTYAFVKKHETQYPGLGKYITATAYESQKDLEKEPNFKKYKSYLEEQGVTILFQIDAQTLHDNLHFKGKFFNHIHFNFPNVPGNYYEGKTDKMLGKFYNSAKHLQKEKDKIYMALPKPPNQDKKDYQAGVASNFFYKGIVYNIYNNTRNSGYRLIKKREFGSKRYDSYQHQQTKKSTSANVAELYPKEYIFEKTTLTPEQILEVDRLREQKPIYASSSKQLIIPEIPTEDNSSDYHEKLLENKTEVIAEISIAKKKTEELKNLIGQPERSLDDNILIMQNIVSLKIYFTNSDIRTFFTHASGLNWKNFISTWYYQVMIGADIADKKDIKNIDMVQEFLNCLLSIIKKDTNKHLSLLCLSLETLFNLSMGAPENTAQELSSFLLKQDVNWRSKTIAFAILMSLNKAKKYSDKELCDIFLKNFSYEPRLDWFICSLMGQFDLSQIILQKDTHDFFNRITDLRLIHRMLKMTNNKDISNQKDFLPNMYYLWVAGFMCGEKTLHPDTVAISHGFSLHLEYNQLTGENHIHSTALIDNIFLPGDSISQSKDGTVERIYTNLQDEHQITSFIIIGNNYFDGANGTRIDYSKALQYYRIPADFGSEQALLRIVMVYSHGLGDFYSESCDQIITYCKKLLLRQNQADHNKSMIHNCYGLMCIIKKDFTEAETHIITALKLDEKNYFAQINQAFLLLIKQNYQNARAILEEIPREEKIIKFHRLNVLGLLHLVEGNDSEGRDTLKKSLKIITPQVLLILLLYREIYFHHIQDHEQAEIFSLEATKLFPENKRLSLPNQDAIKATQQKFITSADNSNTTHPYRLTLRPFNNHTEFEANKVELQIKSSDYSGYLAYIRKENDQFDLIFINFEKEILIPDEKIKYLVTNIISLLKEDKLDDVSALFSVVQQAIIDYAQLTPGYNPSARINDAEHIHPVQDKTKTITLNDATVIIKYKDEKEPENSQSIQKVLIKQTTSSSSSAQAISKTNPIFANPTTPPETDKKEGPPPPKKTKYT